MGASRPGAARSLRRESHDTRDCHTLRGTTPQPKTREHDARESFRWYARRPDSGSDAMLKRDEWFDLARKLDWEFSYVSERDVYPEAVAGRPFLDAAEWRDWDEPYRTSYVEYVTLQSE